MQCDKPRNRSPQGFNPRLRSPSPKKEWKFFKLQWAKAVGRHLAHSDDTGRPPTIKDKKRQPVQTKNIYKFLVSKSCLLNTISKV